MKNTLLKRLFNKNNKIRIETEEDKTFHKLSFEFLKAKFNTCLEKGLDMKQAAELLAKNGKNKIKQPSSNPFFKIIGYLFTG